MIFRSTRSYTSCIVLTLSSSMPGMLMTNSSSIFTSASMHCMELTPSSSTASSGSIYSAANSAFSPIMEFTVSIICCLYIILLFCFHNHLLGRAMLHTQNPAHSRYLSNNLPVHQSMCYVVNTYQSQDNTL